MKKKIPHLNLFPFALCLFAFSLFLGCAPQKKPAIAADKDLDSLLAKGKMSAELLWKFGRVGEMQLSPDGKMILYTVTKYNLKENKGKTNLYMIPSAGGDPVLMADMQTSVSCPTWRPDGKKIAFLASDGGTSAIWEMNTDGNAKQKVSNEERDINGFLYSPTMNKILYICDVKVDQTPAEKYPDLPKTNVKIIEDLNYRHWDKWADYTYSHIFLADYKDGKAGKGMDIMDGLRYDAPLKPFGGMEEICWAPDGNRFAYTSKYCTGMEYATSTNSDIYIYDVKTKTTENLTVAMKGYDKDPVFSPNGRMLVWHSMETPGYEADKDRMFLYDFDTKKFTDASANFDQWSTNFCWSKDNQKVYFISGINATFQVYSLNIKDNQIKQITKGDHDYTNLAVAGSSIIGMKMNMGMPTEIFNIDEQTGTEKQLTFTNKNILDKIKMAKIEKRMVKTTDGQDMLTWVIFPPDFDPAKKYPTLLYCQGGPQDAVSQFFSYRWNFQMMAANGYIVVAPNRRGLPSFGQKWNDDISQDYGGQDMNDYLSAIDEVAREPYVNKDRLGAVGASYGGYSVFWLAGHHEGRFKALIAHCGMFNLESFYAETEETWFPNHDLGGAFWQTPKPKSYEYSPHLYVDKWDAPILIITGGNDFRIPYTESLQAFNAAKLRKVPSKLLYFPEESHFVAKPQNSVLWQREFIAWLDKYLKS